MTTRHPLFCSILPILIFTLPFMAFSEGGGKIAKQTRTATVDIKTLDGNRISCYFSNDGIFGADPPRQGYGMYWRKDSSYGAMYASCPWMAGKERTSGRIRSAAGYVQSDFVPGTINGVYTGSTAIAANQNDPRFHIYKISRSDAAGGVNADYDQWPVDQGAPAGSDGRPLFFGDQQLFFVCNDLDTLARKLFSACPPLGVEMRVLAWCFNDKTSLQDVIFIRWEVINKSIYTYDQTRIGLFQDIDLGYAGDNQTGCDSTLSLGFFYKEPSPWAQTDPVNSPAEGTVFLRAPAQNSSGMPMTSFLPGLKNAGGYLSDLPQGSPSCATLAFNFLCGVDNSGMAIINPVTGMATSYMLSGDPVSGSGWVPSVVWPHWNSEIPPGDRRMIPSSGPFTFSPGDTAVLVAAIAMAQGFDRLSSVSKLRLLAENVRSFYSTSSTLFPEAEVTSGAAFDSATAMVQLRLLGRNVAEASGLLVRQDGSILASVRLFDDGQHGDGSAADGLFANAIRTTQERNSVHLDLRLLSGANDTVQYSGALSRISLIPSPTIDHLNVSRDDLNGDGTINPGENVTLNSPVTSNVSFGYDSLAFTALVPGVGSASGVLSVHQLPANSTAGPSGAVYLNVPQGSPVQTPIPLPFAVEEPTHRNLWIDTVFFSVEPLPFVPIDAPADHVQGSTPGTLYVHLATPLMWKNQLYEIVIPEPYKYSLLDASRGDTLISRSWIWSGVTAPFVDGFKITNGTLKSGTSPQSDDVYTFNPILLKGKIRPADFSLDQNYPNPFNPFTTISYTVYTQSAVSLRIYNLLGQEVVTLVDELESTGDYSVRWRGVNSAGANVASGVYFYHLKIGAQSQVKKMLLVR
jgi:hypothetical protein